MKVALSVIKHMIKTGAAFDMTHDETLIRRPPNSTVVFYSVGTNGLNGIVMMNTVNGQLYAVAGRVSNLFILAA